MILAITLAQRRKRVSPIASRIQEVKRPITMQFMVQARRAPILTSTRRATFCKEAVTPKANLALTAV
jgi:hypothetical protein